MKALLISDLHGNNLFLSKLESMILSYDVILCVGDLTNFGRPDDYVEKISKIVATFPFYWVSGNNDLGQWYQYRIENLKNIDGRITKFHDNKLAGLGGSSENFEAQNFGPSLLSQKQNLNGTILLTHQPPNLPLNYLPYDQNCSSQGVIKGAPKIHICGHLHYLSVNGKSMAQGVACLKGTKVVKLGPASDGYFGELDLETLEVKLLKL